MKENLGGLRPPHSIYTNADIGSDCVWRLVACITLRPSPEAVLCRYLGAGSPNEHPTVKQLSVS